MLIARCVSMVTLWSSLWRGTFLIGTLLEHSFLFILIRNISISFQIIPFHSQYSLFIPKNTFSFMFLLGFCQRIISRFVVIGCFMSVFVCHFCQTSFWLFVLFLSCYNILKLFCCFFLWSLFRFFCVLLRFWWIPFGMCGLFSLVVFLVFFNIFVFFFVRKRKWAEDFPACHVWLSYYFPTKCHSISN